MRSSSWRGAGLAGLVATVVGCGPGAPSRVGGDEVDASIGEDGPDEDAGQPEGDPEPGGGFDLVDAAHPDASTPLCPKGQHTTVSGTVYAPNGTLPLYNVIVYAPAGKLPTLPSGATCEACGALNSVKAYATTLSDAQGHFVLTDPPAGENVPLVVQVGKWRRSVVLPKVTPCTDNPLTDPNLTRLPRNTREGTLPKIGVTTGSSDSIACMLPKLGIDPAEFGVSGSTAVTLYAGSGGNGPNGIRGAGELWDDVTAMKKYDLLVLSCEGTESVVDPQALFPVPGTKSRASFAAMTQYLNAGGRIFGTDFMYTVWKDSPDPGLASAAVIPGGAPPGGNSIAIDTSFPKGKALADWLWHLDPTTLHGILNLDVVFDNVTSAAAPAQVWGRDADGSTHPRFMTINLPIGQPTEKQCGKAVHIDAHVNQRDVVGVDYPLGCGTPLGTGEEAFAFFFFDLASCIQKDNAAPEPPEATAPPIH